MAFSSKAVISLTANEDRLKNLLLDAAASLNSSQVPQRVGQDVDTRQPVILRWAGGWVRDKLLGIDSHDVDVAINCMTGEQFGLELRRFCTLPDIIKKHSIREEDLGSLHTIKANPEKSKHLATATCRVFGVDLDLVNLRKETYSDHSRNPGVEFGTAVEDARRRDATVNALFYNIHTNEVEDFTSGLSDLEAKVIRTPLEPFKTFTDDPLRVLRVIRFASRLRFTIDPDAEQVIADTKVLESLTIKISRERVGIEVEKMLKGKFPGDSLALIHKLGLYHVIFTDPASDMPVPDLSGWQISYQTLDSLATGAKGDHVSIYSRLVRNSEEAHIAWVLAALTPWASIEGPLLPPGKGPKHFVPFITQAAREGIKAPNKLCDIITASHKNRLDILNLKRAVCANAPQASKRDYLAMTILKWDKLGGQWKLQLLYALLAEAVDKMAIRQDPSSNDIEPFMSEWLKFLVYLDEMGVSDAPAVKRLVDGNTLCKALGTKPGKWMTEALDICLAWQFRNPGVEDIEGAIDEVRKRQDELKIPEGKR